MVTKTIHILVGLPGSGKTTWANEQSKQYEHYVYDCDAYIKDRQYTRENILDLLTNDDHYRLLVFSAFSNNTHVYVDGLFLTTDAVDSVIEGTLHMISQTVTKWKPQTINFIIEQWDCNRKACIANDLKRIQSGDRVNNSKTTIENIQFEDIEEGTLELHLGITLNELPNLKKVYINIEKEEHKVIAYDVEDSFLYNYSKNHDGFLESNSWTLGGTWCAYDGRSGSVEAEKQPDFEELDHILENICPQITFLQYKHIMKECVTIEEEWERDYYGGSTTKAFYRCDLKQLYKYLKENNLIKQ